MIIRNIDLDQMQEVSVRKEAAGVVYVSYVDPVDNAAFCLPVRPSDADYLAVIEHFFP